MQDPAQVQSLRLFRGARIFNLADVGQVRVQDVLTPPGRLDLVPLIGQDAVIDVVRLGSVELVPWFPSGIIRENRGIPQEVQNFVGSVRLAVGPGVGIGRVLPENLHDPVFRRLVELAIGEGGDDPVLSVVPGMGEGRGRDE